MLINAYRFYLSLFHHGTLTLKQVPTEITPPDKFIGGALGITYSFGLLIGKNMFWKK